MIVLPRVHNPVLLRRGFFERWVYGELAHMPTDFGSSVSVCIPAPSVDAMITNTHLRYSLTATWSQLNSSGSSRPVMRFSLVKILEKIVREHYQYEDPFYGKTIIGSAAATYCSIAKNSSKRCTYLQVRLRRVCGRSRERKPAAPTLTP